MLLGERPFPCHWSSCLKKFARSLARVETQKVASFGSTTAPIGEWSQHWVDPVHEEDGGDVEFGPRPPCGIDIFKAELDALSLRTASLMREMPLPVPLCCWTWWCKLALRK